MIKPIEAVLFLFLTLTLTLLSFTNHCSAAGKSQQSQSRFIANSKPLGLQTLLDLVPPSPSAIQSIKPTPTPAQQHADDLDSMLSELSQIQMKGNKARIQLQPADRQTQRNYHGLNEHSVLPIHETAALFEGGIGEFWDDMRIDFTLMKRLIEQQTVEAFKHKSRTVQQHCDFLMNEYKLLKSQMEQLLAAELRESASRRGGKLPNLMMMTSSWVSRRLSMEREVRLFYNQLLDFDEHQQRQKYHTALSFSSTPHSGYTGS